MTGLKYRGIWRSYPKTLIYLGEEMPPELWIEVPNSESFSYTSTETDTYFYVQSTSYYGGVQGQEIGEISIGNRGIRMQGGDMRFCATMRIPYTNYELVTLQGESQTAVDIMQTVSGLEIDGMKPTCTISFSGYASADTVPVVLEQNTDELILDLSDISETGTFSILQGNTVLQRVQTDYVINEEMTE